MSSNILAGERRWASARRTGMTVLGKVAVPKPLNLPSQRLENQGLDPNVEIVPKGSLGWGSRPSSSASNPWGSSSLSLNAEGSSPGHASGRPSSSSSRPSTAGSEKTHDRGSNAWGPGSRPSSASEASASNQTSLAPLRPHSAETRPGSSQLSRFAEVYHENVGIQGPVLRAERAGLASSSEKERFSLSSGDFPTLNSSTDISLKYSDSRDNGSHSRPSSASGRVANDSAEMSQAEIERGNVNAWKREGYRSRDDLQPSKDKWPGELQSYPNSNMSPPQFDGWHGPSMNHPAGVWYQGLPPGPPYGAPVAPGGFPVEPFPYYCPPQITPAGLANPQPVPRPVAGPRGHPKNGELYRPQMPDTFVRPGMPFRPGFYHGPMPFEGYYGPPIGYCNPKEHEVRFKGMAAGPPVYNRYPAHDSEPVPYTITDGDDSTKSHNKAGKNSSTVKGSPEKAETAQFDDAPGHHRVLLKQTNRNAITEGESQENVATQNFAYPKKKGQPGMVLRTKEWSADYNSEDDVHSKGTVQSVHSSSSPSNDRVGSSPVNIRSKSYGTRSNVAVCDIQLKNLETAASSFPVLPHTSLAGDGGLSSSATTKDPTLIQKIEGLNEKIRASECRDDGLYTSQWEDKKGSGAIIGEIIVPLGDKTSQLAAGPMRPYGVVRGKADDGQRRKLAAPVLASDVLPGSTFLENKTNLTMIAAETLSDKNEAASLTEVFDSTNSQAQRTKVRELAKQRALQLQKEEEERTREQKVKALAKLEELNRRTPGVSTMNPKDEKLSLTGISHPEQGPHTLVGSSQAGVKSLSHSAPLASTPATITQQSKSSGEWGEDAADSAHSLPSEALETAVVNSTVLPCQSLRLKEEMPCAGDHEHTVTTQLNDTGASRNKRSGNKAKQNVSKRMNGSGKTVISELPKINAELGGRDVVVTPGDFGSSVDSNIPNTTDVTAEFPSQQRRNNRSSKNKNKPNDVASSSVCPSSCADESNPVSTDNEISKAPHSGLIDASVHAPGVGDGVAGLTERQHSLSNEGARGSVNYQRKSQQPRRVTRSQQTDRFLDKYHANDNVVWAPVHPQNKIESGNEVGPKTGHQESMAPARSDDQVHNIVKSKRAEIERYVPKPVAKELAQQSVQQSDSSSSCPPVSEAAAEKVEPELKSSGETGDAVDVNVAPVTAFRKGDLRYNKQPKSLAGWRQRGSVETRRVKGAQNGSSITSSPSKKAQLSMGQNESMKPELTDTKADESGSKEFSTSDGGNMWNHSGAGVSPHGRDQSNTGKGKRYIKAERSIGRNQEHESNTSSQKTDKSYNVLHDHRLNQTERNISSKENRGYEERSSSHWQPKSHSAPDTDGGSSTVTQSVAVEKYDMGELFPHNVKHIREIDSRIDQCGPENNNFDGVLHGHQTQRRGRKLHSSKGRPYSPGEGSVGVDESSHAMHAESQTKHLPSDNRRSRYQNARPYSLSEGSVGVDESTHTMHAESQTKHLPSDNRRSRYQNARPVANREFRREVNQERYGQNLHNEYQQGGPEGGKKPENFEDGADSAGPRYKERGQGHFRRGRGHFHGRQSQSSNVQVGAGYD